MLDIQGTELSEQDAELILHPEVGGLILFSRNYVDRAQLSTLVAQVRALRADLIVAVDQEGGRVQRFREGFETLPSIQKIADLARANPAQSDSICFSLGWLMATDVLSADIDISFAPVLDLDRDSCSVIADRSFSEDPLQAVQMGRAYLQGMGQAGMAATAKHFPGHGGVVADSHLQLPVDNRTMDELRCRDLIPFAELMDGYDAVMPGHLSYPNIDRLPVGFSPFWLQQVLRKELGFQGLIFSDDLTMEGAAASGSYRQRAKLAMDAGCDMLLVCNNRTGAIEVLEYIQSLGSATNNSRIEIMRARKKWCPEDIHRSEIYAQAHNYLDQIRKLN